MLGTSVRGVKRRGSPGAIVANRSTMDVFLVPVGADRYELYCEEPDEVPCRRRAADWRLPPLAHGSGRSSPRRSASAAAGRRPMRRRPGSCRASRRGLLRWVAESIAEQRLLWQLRGRVEARPDLSRRSVAPSRRRVAAPFAPRDWERHRFWLVVDGLGLIASAALILLPGPNLRRLLLRLPHRRALPVAARRAAGSREGAVDAGGERAALGASRDGGGGARGARRARVDAVAATLRLEHLASFFQRTATP